MFQITNRTYQHAKEFIAERGYASPKTIMTKFQLKRQGAIALLDMLVSAEFISPPTFKHIYKITNSAKW